MGETGLKSNIQKVQVHNVRDSYSFLEQIRAYQLSDILGRYKLF